MNKKKLLVVLCFFFKLLSVIAQEDIEFYIKQIQSPDLKIRFETLNLLKKMETKASFAIPFIINYALINEFQDSSLTLVAAETLICIKTDATELELLRSILKILQSTKNDSSKISLSLATLYIIKSIKSKDSNLIPILIESLEDNNADIVREEVILLLSTIKPFEPEAIEALIRVVYIYKKYGHLSTEKSAIYALGEIGTPAIPAIPFFLPKIWDIDFSEEVLSALEKINSQEVYILLTLEKALLKGDLQLRINIAKMLGKLRWENPIILNALQNTLQNAIQHQELEVTLTCIHTLGEIGIPAKITLPLLQELWSKNDPSFKEELSQTLYKITGQEWK